MYFGDTFPHVTGPGERTSRPGGLFPWSLHSPGSIWWIRAVGWYRVGRKGPASGMSGRVFLLVRLDQVPAKRHGVFMGFQEGLACAFSVGLPVSVCNT